MTILNRLISRQVSFHIYIWYLLLAQLTPKDDLESMYIYDWRYVRATHTLSINCPCHCTPGEASEHCIISKYILYILPFYKMEVVHVYPYKGKLVCVRLNVGHGRDRGWSFHFGDCRRAGGKVRELQLVVL